MSARLRRTLASLAEPATIQPTQSSRCPRPQSTPPAPAHQWQLPLQTTVGPTPPSHAAAPLCCPLAHRAPSQLSSPDPAGRGLLQLPRPLCPLASRGSPQAPRDPCGPILAAPARLHTGASRCCLLLARSLLPVPGTETCTSLGCPIGALPVHVPLLSEALNVSNSLSHAYLLNH